MEWIILFAVSWLLFIVLVDLKQLKINIWCGLLAFACQLAVDSMAKEHGLYHIEQPVICILGSSLFFGLGPVIVIGVLLAQFHPVHKRLVILNILKLTTLYSFQELILVSRNILIYDNWHFMDSLFLNFVVITLLSWFSIVILGKGSASA